MSEFEHDLASFVAEFHQSIEQDYRQIRSRVKEDPGTAGDQAENSWAELLKAWLPPQYKVVVKGRILGVSGNTSPQYDVIVLSPDYPLGLLKKKHYLAAGVLAAFECKLTLRPHHIGELFERRILANSAVEREWTERRNIKKNENQDFAFEEYHGLFDVGLLAHSFDGFGNDSVKSISNRLRVEDQKWCKKVHDMIDLLCVADLGCWSGIRSPYSFGYKIDPSTNQAIFSAHPHPQSGYDSIHYKSWYEGSSHHLNFSPIGALIARLWHKLSFRDPQLLSLSRYYTTALSAGKSEGPERVWSNIHTPEVLWKKYQALGATSPDSNVAAATYYKIGFHAS